MQFDSEYSSKSMLEYDVFRQFKIFFSLFLLICVFFYRNRRD